MRRKINKLIEELEKLWDMSLYLMENDGVLCTHMYEVRFNPTSKTVVYGETLQQLYDNLQDILLYEKGLLKGDKR